MSSISENFLHHLWSTSALQQSGEISIVQDNANSSHHSRSRLFLVDSWSGDSGSTANNILMPRIATSRWEPAVAVDDDLPYIPIRQDSNKGLFPKLVDSRKSTNSDNTDDLRLKKDSQPQKPRRQSSSRDLALPRIPRRQKSFGDKGALGNSGDQEIRRIPQIQNRTVHSPSSANIDRGGPLPLVSPLQ